MKCDDCPREQSGSLAESNFSETAQLTSASHPHSAHQWSQRVTEGELAAANSGFMNPLFRGLGFHFLFQLCKWGLE